jgi:sugar O-acyltransferase (sialic acid O-acetyltransferase NeuD family)
MDKVIIFGLNDTAELAHYYLTNDSIYEVIGFTVEKEYCSVDIFKPRNSATEYPVVPFEALESYFPPNEYFLFAPMTGKSMNLIRKRIYLNGKEKGYNFISYISSRATICHNKIGENCFILEDNTIQPFTEIGNNVVLWSGNHIGHHGKIEDNVFITSHVVVSGHCLIRENAWIGVNATIRDYTTIGKSCLIAMGSLVTADTDENGFYLGSPAKKQVKQSNEIYK